MHMPGIKHKERGGVGGWILVIFLVIVVGIGGYLFVLNRGWMEAPEALASQPWMSSILPKEEEALEDEAVEVSLEDTLRHQNLVLRGERDSALARITTLEQQLADKDRLVLEREDEIARLRDALNLAQDQNISNVALIYENMDPEDAAKFLSNLGPEKASLILAEMRESDAADVLSLMDETIATQITQIMAGFEGELAEVASSTETPPPVSTGPVVPVPSSGATGE